MAVPEPFVDAHVHFWDHAEPGLWWQWLDPGFEHPRLKGMYRLDAPRYTPPELRAEAGDAAPSMVVHVQSAALTDDPTRETVWLESVASVDGWPNALVAASRLRAEGAGAALAANARHPLFRGVRDMSVTAAVTPDEVAEVFDVASAVGACVELQLPYEHFGSIRDLAARWPDVTLVLGHAGQPVERTPSYFERWSTALVALAGAVPNVVVKVSALASGADPDWTVESIGPWVLGCIEAFGADRSMLATNWPIDRLHGRYGDLVAAYRTITAALPDDERAAVWHGTATRVYRL
jgi:predicted TIM-barrel fold metal-dependent hydrolase